MIGLSRRVRVFAYTRPVDMRKQYDGLYALVVAELKADPVFQECQKIIAEIRARKARLGARHVATSHFSYRAYGGAWIGR